MAFESPFVFQQDIYLFIVKLEQKEQKSILNSLE